MPTFYGKLENKLEFQVLFNRNSKVKKITTKKQSGIITDKIQAKIHFYTYIYTRI